MPILKRVGIDNRRTHEFQWWLSQRYGAVKKLDEGRLMADTEVSQRSN